MHESESLMHESESSPSHSVLESKSSHESLNLAHESDSSPSPGLEYYNTVSLMSRNEMRRGNLIVERRSESEEGVIGGGENISSGLGGGETGAAD